MSYSAFLQGATVVEIILKSILNTYMVTKRGIIKDEFDIKIMDKEK